ncbi:phosphoribosylglycinamide formyltransferase [Bosea sp. LjRoot90]|uniref:phosphoribosylglycinamide formyltransferase n=1 Tax=Bosea sp. LjRoot90 TaxID=3342342 RepID=UPI003ECE99D1
MSKATRRARTAILISGRGSNMVALIEAAKAADFPAEIVLVAANLPDAGGLERAAAAGIATASVDHRLFGKDREAFERALDDVLRAGQVELIALAGFMRVLTPWFVTRWQGRLINIHPSLLPDFRGTHTHARALEAGVAEHGCTVHFVVPELDAGPTILQAKVPVLPGDDEASLSARVLEQEHKIYPEGLALVASGAARLEDGAALSA